MEHDPGRPAYLRIADELRARITSGELAEGAKLPSIPEISRTWDVASQTAVRAVQTLVGEGLVIPRSGSGTYVRARPQLRQLVRTYQRGLGSGSPFARQMQEQGRRGSWDYDSHTVQAPPNVRDRLGLEDPAGDEPDCVETRYLYRTDGDPAMLTTSWEPLHLTRGTDIVIPEEGPHAGRGVAERMLAIGIQVIGSIEVVGARPGTAEECDALQLAPGSVMMTIKRSYLASDDQVVEVAEITVPAELFELVYSWRIDT